MVYFLLKCFSHLPLRILKTFTFVVYVFLRFVVAYRRKVIFQNLKYAFPLWNEKHIKNTANAHYRYLASFLVETLKLLTISSDALKKSIVIENLSKIEQSLQEGKSVLLLSIHYADWNWLATALPLFIEHKVFVVYEEFKNKVQNELLYRIRTRFKAELLLSEVVFRRVSRHTSAPFVLLLAADQCPDDKTNKTWYSFLGRPTLFYDRFMLLRRFSPSMTPLFIYSCGKQKNRYSFMVEDLDEKNGLMEDYIAKLEKVILTDVSKWFWYHKRWKFTKDEIKIY
ncbi:MAG: lysophospholipid acyltransferase family protein [Flammeovirgaceae bacterium]|nr:lysophospholipid acyltransferase family protein [Flammeovirgaceae bacterium]MDW8286800.1 lysophospholipid acyltransferase family protein [Flammeovirgaceae bacterium]